jgi:hypothetical protein
MLLTLYGIQIALTIIVGVVTYSLIKPSIAQGRRAIIAGLVALLFTLVMSGVIESLGLVPDYRDAITDTE